MKKPILFLLALVTLLSNANAQWKPTSNPPGGSVWAMAVIGSKIFAGTASGGVYLSTDEGATWLKRNGAFPNMQVWALATKGTDIYAGTGGSFGAGVYKSSDDGITWTNITPVGMSSSSNVRSLALNDTVIFAGTFGGGGIFMSHLNSISTTSWTSFNTGWTNGNFDTRALKIKGGNIYAGTYGKGVWVSTISTPNWNITSSTMLSNAGYIEAIDIKDSMMFAGNISGSPVLYRSNNNGLNWIQSSTSVFLDKPVYAITHRENKVYAGTEGAGVLISSDNGVTWTQFNDGFKDSSGNWFCNQINVRSFAFNGATFYAGTDCGVWKRSISITPDSSFATGINNIYDKEQFSFYPNPAKEMITINVNSSLLGSIYTISDQLGRAILNGKISDETSLVNIGELVPGMYIISIGNIRSHNFKLLKQ